MHILVVADEDWVLEDVSAALGESRFEITTTSDPHGIIDLCKDTHPDVVIVDLQVGAMGGMAVIRSIRGAIATDKLAPMPTILLMDRAADTFIARRAGADAAIRKPFGAFALRDLLDGLVKAEAS